MKNVLLLVHDDTGQEARFQVALDLTRLVEGHLICLDVAVPPPALIDDPAAEIAGVTLLMNEIQRESANRSLLEQRLAHEAVSWEWRDALGRLARSLRNAASFADVIVMNRELDAFPVPDMRAEAGEVIVRSGKPVLAVPAAGQGFDPRCALIAWDGSVSAIRALQRAVPLLQHSDRVFVTAVGGSDDDDVAEAARYLSRYEVHARIERVSAGELEIGDILVDEAVRHRAGLIVAGGYGTSRAHEALFGGVTRYLLTHAPCPVFVVH